MTPAPKCFSRGTARSRHPEETLALLLPELSRFGITRLACVTGLDRIGIPVYQAVRPNARSLAVSQGKGADETSAKVSALMESLECHHAEHANCDVRLESYRALRRSGPVANPMQLPLSRTSAFGPNLTLPWTRARDAIGDVPTWVPFELVHANTTIPRVPGSGCFVCSTNGLASGNNRAEAVLHAACEVIERDAHALWKLRDEAAKRETRLDLGSVEHPVARELLARYDSAGIAVMAWDMTSDVGVAVVQVSIFDPEADVLLNPYPAAYGAGCHPDRGIALCRALSEAAQSRLTTIAGARDDLTNEGYRSFRSQGALDHFRRLSAEATRRDFGQLPHASGDTIDADLDHVVERLQQIGVSSLLEVDLSSEGLDMAFTRVVIPGLEGPTESRSYRPGPRAQRALAAQRGAR